MFSSSRDKQYVDFDGNQISNKVNLLTNTESKQES